jgi:hypothetical protein
VDGEAVKDVVSLRMWLAEHHVVHLLNVPHTPQHNAWIERAFRQELKAEAGLGAGVVLDSPDEALARSRGCSTRGDGSRSTGPAPAWADTRRVSIECLPRGRA